MISKEQLEAIEKRLGNFKSRKDEGTSLHGARRDYTDFVAEAPTDIKALLETVEVLREALRESVALVRNGDLDRYLKFHPNLSKALAWLEGE